VKTIFLTARTYLELCKLNLSAFSAFSAATGFIVARSGLGSEIIYPLIAVFILAAGACALNQYQERYTDALMDRTKKRPLPDGRIDQRSALYFSLFVILSGLLILFIFCSRQSLALGFGAVLLYNGAYTQLKKKTAFAAIPGALIGALPPAIGWIEGGGGFPDRQVIALCFFFLIWQVTHFWLLFLSFGKDYEKTGLPCLTNLLGESQMKRIAFVWVFATAVSCIVIPLFGIIVSGTVSVLIIITAAWLIQGSLKLFRTHNKDLVTKYLLGGFNRYILLIMLLISIDRIVLKNIF
jgi:protoheme IX farnesyltransferase